jgi:hypothetical protein
MKNYIIVIPFPTLTQVVSVSKKKAPAFAEGLFPHHPLLQPLIPALHFNFL